ncbi:MAG: tRNA (adenosine(37)-N6)-threonylcarbamoyltransferase complex ATPase subunit type 1 TsaE [Chlamydiia bacterium]|nr:tRNA (adenosine(37)-N6)-threonylcarbamoyltransferase complex ATPase subunit type 1 TsaE [Chlamydiia bacterium]
MDRRITITSSNEETITFGRELGARLQAPCVVTLVGELGAGKTTLAKGLIHGIVGVAAETVTSPTFVMMNLYQKNDKEAYHFDLYRMKHPDEFVWQGFLDYFSRGGISIIEWSERIAPLLPEERIEIELFHQECSDQRKICVKCHERML